MDVVMTPTDKFLFKTGARPRAYAPNQHLVGRPFWFLTQIGAAGAAVPLNTAAVITSDSAVKTAWNTGAVPKAFLRIEAVQLVFHDDDFRKDAWVEKEKIFESLELELKRGSNPTQYIPIGKTSAEPVGPPGLATGNAANFDYQTIRGNPYRLAKPETVDLERDTFQLGTHTALTAARDCYVTVWGHMWPNNLSTELYDTSGDCDGDTDPDKVAAIIAAQKRGMLPQDILGIPGHNVGKTRG